MSGPTPTEVVGLTDAIDISAGEEHVCARRASGPVVCWGDDYLGDLGDMGAENDSATFLVVAGENHDAQLVSLGDDTCVLRGDDSVGCWGLNTANQIGTGDGKTYFGSQTVLGVPALVQLGARCGIDSNH